MKTKKYKILTDPQTLFQSGDMYFWKKAGRSKEWQGMADSWIGSTLLDATGTIESFKEIIWRREIKKLKIG